MARIVLVIWVGTVASADDRMVRMSNSPGTIGKLVKDREGKVLGRIHDVVFHWRSDGYTEYVVLSLGGFWGVGEDHVAVPWEVLTPSTRKEHFVVNTNQVQLSEDHELVGYRFYDPLIRCRSRRRSIDSRFSGPCDDGQHRVCRNCFRNKCVRYTAYHGTELRQISSQCYCAEHVGATVHWGFRGSNTWAGLVPKLLTVASIRVSHWDRVSARCGLWPFQSLSGIQDKSFAADQGRPR